MIHTLSARIGALVAAVLVVAAAVVEYVRVDSVPEALEAAVAAVIALAVACLAISLPGTTARSAVVGGTFVAAGILTWTSTDRPIFIWGVLAAGGLCFLLWSRPWLEGLRQLPRVGAAWTGIAYWPLGVVGALLVGHWTVGIQRLAYAGIFVLAALVLIAIVRAGDRDPSVGIAAAVLVAIAVLLLAGSGSLFDSVRQIPPGSGSAQLMRDRFWGGLGVYYQPNALAGLAVISAIRVAPDRAFALWQRLSVLAVAGVLLGMSNSRTGLIFAFGAACLHGLLTLWRLRPDLPSYRRRWLAVLTPFLVIGLVVVYSQASGKLTRNRFEDSAKPPSSTAAAVTSGRTDTWKQVWVDWENAGVAEKLFGDARTSRAVVTRLNDGAPVNGPRVQLNTDNAFVGAFRRGGVFGALAFVAGVLLLLWHALRRRRDGVLPAAWWTIGAIAVIPTIMSEDWLLGGTNGAVWLTLLAGEIYVVFRAAPRRVEAEPEPAVSV
ncbi:O-antigen ligase family protein [Cryptosporangium phraense]|uniref:O-antigen ligase family protein n=1 Tax=Cryptosporangium phraense TaxID=2593070 RepID=A0A545AS66_9ACTN|nr:O-antigen ligase family protein [Cryptosporangium phraense]TQS44091.1 O-antigen ligase family protein [Cryptosporangium phraense]